jgi:hypothetical protein
MLCGRRTTKTWSISFINNRNTKQSIHKYKIIARIIENITRSLLHGRIKWKFYEKMYFVKIFFCLFCNFRGSKITRTRTQNREKQSGLMVKNKDMGQSVSLGKKKCAEVSWPEMSLGQSVSKNWAVVSNSWVRSVLAEVSDIRSVPGWVPATRYSKFISCS